MITTIAAGRAELSGLLCADFTNHTPSDALKQAGITAVYPWEPTSPRRPVSVTVFSSGMDPNFFNYEIRIYRSLVDTDVLAAQDELDAIVMAVDGALGAHGSYGPSAWTIGLSDERDALVALCRILRGREDF